jgi:hypothetical protein
LPQGREPSLRTSIHYQNDIVAFFGRFQKVMSIRDDTRHHRADVLNQNCRQLWGAVILQAKEDIRHQPLCSIEYEQAVAFFTGSGEWAEMRTVISDFVEVHRDDLESVGRGFINDRRALSGLPPLPARQPATASRRTPRVVPYCRTAAISAGQPTFAAPGAVPGATAGVAYPRTFKKSRSFNPFFPRGTHSIPDDRTGDRALDA